MTDLQYPVTLDQIPKFEKANKLSVIVLGYNEDDNDIYPLKASSNLSSTVMTLFLLTSVRKSLLSGESEKVLSRLLGYRSKHARRPFVCHFFLHPFTSEVKQENHLSCGILNLSSQFREIH